MGSYRPVGTEGTSIGHRNPTTRSSAPSGTKSVSGSRNGRHHDRIRARSVGQVEHLPILETAHEVVPYDSAVIDEQTARGT